MASLVEVQIYAGKLQKTAVVQILDPSTCTLEGFLPSIGWDRNFMDSKHVTVPRQVQ